MRSFALLALLAPLAGAQATLNVPAEYATIQAALDAASPGDTVLVAKGIYPEHVQLRENVNLIGVGQRTVVIEGSGTGDVVTANAIHKFKLENLTIRGAKTVGGNLGAGVLVMGTPCCTFSVTAQIRRCRIVDNGDGIRVEAVHAGTLTIDTNTIDRNARYGVSLHTGNTTILRNTIVQNGGCGISSVAGSGSIIAHSNAIAFNGAEGLLRQAGSPTSLSYNDTFGNAGGDYMELVSGGPTSFTPAPGTGEKSADPGFYSVENGDYHVAPGSPLISAGNPLLPLDFDGTAAEIGAQTYLPAYTPSSFAHGAGCGPEMGWFMEAILGQPYFESQVSLAPPLAPALMLLGVNASSYQGLPLPFDLGMFGAPGCSLLVGPILTFPSATNGTGEGLQKVTIPNDPVLVGALFHHQWMVSSPGANPLGFVFSNAVATKILQ